MRSLNFESKENNVEKVSMDQMRARSRQTKTPKTFYGKYFKQSRSRGTISISKIESKRVLPKAKQCNYNSCDEIHLSQIQVQG